MPRRYAKSKRKRNRRYGRRRARFYKKPTALGLPMSKFARLRYTEAIVLDPGVGGLVSKYHFRANSLYDPNSAGTGHQPMTFDQIATFYNHYVVTGAKMTLKAYSTDPTTAVPNILGIMLNDDNTTPAEFSEVIEQRKCRYTIVSPAQKVATLTSTFSAKKFFNVSDIKDNYDRLGASVDTNPTEGAFFTIFALPMNSSTDTAAFNVLVTIDYIAHFSEPKDIQAS